MQYMFSTKDFNGLPMLSEGSKWRFLGPQIDPNGNMFSTPSQQQLTSFLGAKKQTHNSSCFEQPASSLNLHLDVS